MKGINIHEVVKKLVGSIEPVGETHTDGVRYENLRVMTDLVEKLLRDIDYVASQKSHEFSIKKASEFASKFYDRLGIEE